MSLRHVIAALLVATAAPAAAETFAITGGTVAIGDGSEPIPGGIELGPGQVFHVWAPGPAEITLPFTGVTLQGVDVESTTIRDFSGFSAVAFHVGTATANDGTRFDLETDVRAFQGTYIDRTGRRRFGTFGFI